MKMDIDRLTELANKILKQQSTEIKYRSICNLQDDIRNDISDIISCCSTLIENNKGLRFSDYFRNIYIIHGDNIARKCLRLCTENFNDIVEYENDTTEKKAERQQKLKEFSQVNSIQPTQIQHKGIVSPDLIYCQNGIYRQYNEVYKSFEYNICRKIQRNRIDNTDLEPIFQAVCLFVALKNEQKIIEEELLLSGVNIELNQKQVVSIPQKTDNLNLPSELNTNKAKALLQKAIQNGLCSDNYSWLKTKALLAYFADCASEYLNIGKGEYDGKPKTSWKPFEILFGINGLSMAKQDYQKTGTLPHGYKDVDILFY